MAQQKRAKFAREKTILKPNPAANNGNDAINRLSAEDVDPLPESRAKKRKKDTVFPSMPVIAAMLLSDPFVVRLLLDKVLRAIRDSVFKDRSVPGCHQLVPSVLQLLHLSQFSTKLCAIKGRRFMIPDPGLIVAAKNAKEEEAVEKSISTIISALERVASSLRKFVPLFFKLLLEMNLETCTMLRVFYQHVQVSVPQNGRVYYSSALIYL